ncbi:MAG: Molecular chaperone Hsp31 and glyoxalase 3 [Acinetobacter bereziniae]|uniref:Molecular chaperone Hsp31 and glyoxalase 3 n=1 Tax=Acinetobacter bereziniae TaxID=106648 RepID=A0A833PAG0_ACIBZ|nr:MAG: Molecular chaperone Hsp31 and glyoxalase 3 [Acinetobacter bereziniae]
MKILIILSSVSRFPKLNKPTGSWLEELYIPFTAFREAGLSIDFTSPQGGEVSIDPVSIEMFKSHALFDVYKSDLKFDGQLQSTIPLNQIDAGEYAAVFIPGGYAPLFDLYKNAELDSVLEKFIEKIKLFQQFAMQGAHLFH